MVYTRLSKAAGVKTLRAGANAFGVLLKRYRTP